jgi:hypothetical protein
MAEAFETTLIDRVAGRTGAYTAFVTAHAPSVPIQILVQNPLGNGRHSQRLTTEKAVPRLDDLTRW